MTENNRQQETLDDVYTLSMENFQWGVEKEARVFGFSDDSGCVGVCGCDGVCNCNSVCGCG